MKIRTLALFVICTLSMCLNATKTYGLKDTAGKNPEEIKQYIAENLEFLRKTNTCVGCYLKEANLAGWNLQRAKLAGAILIGMQATGASLNKADLTDADCTDAKFNGADLTGIKTSAKTKFDHADLTNTALNPAFKKDPYSNSTVYKEITNS